MAREDFNPGDLVSLRAGADLSAKQFHFFELDTTARVTACNATTDEPLGIIQGDPDAANEECPVLMVPGKISKLQTDGSGTSIAIGSKLGVDTSGRGVVQASGSFYALALQACTVVNGIIPVIFTGKTAV